MFKTPFFHLSPLLISLFIYLIYRTEYTLINQLFSAFTPNELVFFQKIIRQSIPLPNLVIYSLPEGLWVIFVTQISKEFTFRFNQKTWNLTFLPLISAIGIEFVQYLHLTDGTYDPWDIMMVFLCWAIALLLIPPKRILIKTNNQNIIKQLLLVSSYLIIVLSDVF